MQVWRTRHATSIHLFMVEHTRTVTAAVTRRRDRSAAGTLPVCGQQAPELRKIEPRTPSRSSCFPACCCSGRAPISESEPPVLLSSRWKQGSVRLASRAEETWKTARTCREHQLRGRERGRVRKGSGWGRKGRQAEKTGGESEEGRGTKGDEGGREREKEGRERGGSICWKEDAVRCFALSTPSIDMNSLAPLALWDKAANIHFSCVCVSRHDDWSGDRESNSHQAEIYKLFWPDQLFQTDYLSCMKLPFMKWLVLLAFFQECRGSRESRGILTGWKSLPLPLTRG